MGQNMVIDESWQVLRKIFETHGIRRTYHLRTGPNGGDQQ